MRSTHLAWAGMLTPFVLGLTLIVFAVLRPDYSQLTQAISELGIQGAPFAAYWNGFGFLLVGALIVSFAWGLYSGLAPRNGASLTAALVAASGFGWMGLGVVPAAAGFAPSLQTSLHFVMVALNVLPFLASAFLFAYCVRADPFWRPYGVLSLVLGAVALATFFIPATIPVGVSQRIGIGAYFVWLMLMGAALRHAAHEA